MRKFIVGAYWGGLLTVAMGLLPIIVFRPRLLPLGSMEELQQLTPVLLLAGFALLTSVLAAGTMVILREIAAVRARSSQKRFLASGLTAMKPSPPRALAMRTTSEVACITAVSLLPTMSPISTIFGRP